MKFFKIFLLMTLIVGSASVFALSLKEARKKNMVSEQASGYLKAENKNAKDLVAEINKKRKKEYEKIAKKNKVTVDSVAKHAGKVLLEKYK